MSCYKIGGCEKSNCENCTASKIDYVFQHQSIYPSTAVEFYRELRNIDIAAGNSAFKHYEKGYADGFKTAINKAIEILNKK